MALQLERGRELGEGRLTASRLEGLRTPFERGRQQLRRPRLERAEPLGAVTSQSDSSS